MITSKENVSYKKWLKLAQKKYRQKEGLFLIEGQHLVQEALKANAIVEVLLCEGVQFEIDAPVTYLSKSLFDQLSLTVTSAGIMAVCVMGVCSIENEKRLLLVDGVQDPGNLGTLIRSALAFGFDGMILSVNTVDVYNEKVIRSTQGAIFKLPIIRGDLAHFMADLQKADVKVYAAALNDKAVPMEEIKRAPAMAFIVGNEGAGVDTALIEASCGSVVIQMSEEVESLNVGVAGSILMQHFNGLS